METMQMILQAITTVGFPIVMCGCLMYYINSTLENVRKTMTELNSAILELKGVLDNDKEKHHWNTWRSRCNR